MSRDIDEVEDKRCRVEPVISERVAPELRRGDEAPLSEHGPGVNGSRQQRLHVLPRLEEVAVHFLGPLHVLTAASLVSQGVRAHSDDVAFSERRSGRHARGVDKRPVR